MLSLEELNECINNRYLVVVKDIYSTLEGKDGSLNILNQIEYGEILIIKDIIWYNFEGKGIITILVSPFDCFYLKKEASETKHIFLKNIEIASLEDILYRQKYIESKINID